MANFLSSALNSNYGGSWSDGQGGYFTSDEQALALELLTMIITTHGQILNMVAKTPRSSLIYGHLQPVKCLHKLL